MSRADVNAEGVPYGRALYQRDACAQSLGVELEAQEPGYARARMTVTDTMLNGGGACHGGMLFALADCVFGYACQSGPQISVAAGCSIEYLRPGLLGEEMTAEARERHLAGRLGVTDVEIRNPAGELVAIFRGKSYRTRMEQPEG